MGAPILEPEPDPTNPSFRDVLDLALETKDVLMPNEAAGFRASSLGYCMRRQYFERLGIERTKPTDRWGRRTMFLGDIIHRGVQQVFENAGLLLAEELTLESPEYDLTGHVDMIWGGKPYDLTQEQIERFKPQWIFYLEELRGLLHAYDRIPVVGTEMKSAHQFSAEKMFAEGPSFHHIMQAGAYKLMAEAHPEQLPESVPEIDAWQITVLAKSDLKIPIFEIRDAHVARAEERAAMLHDLWEGGKVPPCTCGVDLAWERRYCAYRDPDSADKDPACCSPYLMDTALELELVT